MELRKNITVVGNPLTWDTNLPDEDIDSFHKSLAVYPHFADEPISHAGCCLRISIFHEMVPFRDGYCLCIAVGKHVWAIFRTQSEWELFEARKREQEELRQEQEDILSAEVLIFKAQDKHLLEMCTQSTHKQAWEDAKEWFIRRVELRKAHPELERRAYHQHNDSEQAMSFFVQLPDIEFGLAYYKAHKECAFTYERMADMILRYMNPSDAESSWRKIDAVFNCARQQHPTIWLMFKHFAMLYVRREQWQRAIHVCEAALAVGLHDDTKTGFAGRMSRIKRQLSHTAHSRTDDAHV